MESVHDSEPASVPVSPPRRDSMEDADSTLTRKRPRLDSGSRATRSMSADLDNTAAHPTQPTSEPVEVTINVRSHNQSSQPASSAAANDNVSNPSTSTHTSAVAPNLVGQSQADGAGETSANSPPVVEIQLSDDDEEDMADYRSPQVVQIDDDNDWMHDFFETFPYVDKIGNYTQAVQTVEKHLQTAAAIEYAVIPSITSWMDTLPDRQLYNLLDYAELSAAWDDLGSMVNKFVLRRQPFGEDFSRGETEEIVVIRFFQHYVKLCVRLMKIDADNLTRFVDQADSDHVLFCTKHLKPLNTILRVDKGPIFHLLANHYGADLRRISTTFAEEFLKPQNDGVQHWTRLTSLAWEKLAPKTFKYTFTVMSCQILDHLGWLITDELSVPPSIDRSKLYRNYVQLFRLFDNDLQTPGKILDVNFNKDLIMQCAVVLHSVSTWNSEIADGLATEYLGFDGVASPASEAGASQTEVASETSQYDSIDLPALVSNAWRFKLLKKYILKGRMELRVMSIGIMDAALIELWREYQPCARGTNHPVMQYFARFLLHEKVVDYIVGVDSHPQLMSRSGNIVGFLVVTNQYKDQQTDAIWNTVSNSSDPRVVTATMAMLRQIVNLMDPTDLLYLNKKLYDLPIEAYTLDILRFAREISQKIHQKVQNWDLVPTQAKPASLFVRMIQDTAPSRASTNTTTSYFHESSEQLRVLLPAVASSEREQLFEDCVNNIAQQTSKATGSAHAICVLASDRRFEPSALLADKEDLIQRLVQELCAFVEAEKSQGPYSYQPFAMMYRLELLEHVLRYSSDSLPSELYGTLWDHLFGKDAVSKDMRDRAWLKFTEAARVTPGNTFCTRTLSEYIPKLEPTYFTRGLYDFVSQATAPLLKRKVRSPDGEHELLDIAGSNLLWRFVLSAPSGTIEEQSAGLLALRYVDVYRVQGVTWDEVEDAHIALVEQCTQGLLSSYHAIRSGNEPFTPDSSDSMAIIPSEDDIRAHELRFTRTLLFQRTFLQLLRTRSEYMRTRRADSKCDYLEPETICGEPIEIRFQAFGGLSNEKQTIIMGKEDSFQDLYDRLCRLSGFTKATLIMGGRKLDIAENSRKKIGEIEGVTWILVSKAPGAEVVQPQQQTGVNASAFESSILKDFEKLFACMDSDDRISEAMFEFLCLFPPRERITELVAAGEASTEAVFPPGKVFQAKYSALALQTKLRGQLNKGIVDEAFLAHTIRLLSSALLNNELISTSLAGRHDLALAGLLISVLLAFLKERPLQDVSAQYFSDESLLVDRLLAVLSKSMETQNDHGRAINDCYATILEAALHSRNVWDAFVKRQDILYLHKALLLADQRISVRFGIHQSIASVCGGDLPSTSPLSAGEIASCYWKIISAILPEAVGCPHKAHQLFRIAEQVFRRNDEFDRDENVLRGFMTAWSNLLLHYKHEEFVGRDETDVVILGFTKLLLCCIQSLKSFKKPLNAGDLMENLFTQFLFPAIVEIEDESDLQLQLPVLESSTRRELYDLILALAEDRSNYEKLLSLSVALYQDDEDPASKVYSIDRANEIRGSAGYVGLINPRAICYMNSLMTQLFMNLNFRKFFLEAKVADAGGSQRLLAETQSLFSQMQGTYRKAADPRDFIACVKGLDSLPIDMNIQMDADEFYNLLFDQWEGQMLSQETKQLFRSFYGGQTVNQIKSKECEHVSERVESFFVIQCDVQGKANLQESLQSFVEGDVMEGDNKYKCESCGGRFVDAVKRTCLKDVPDNLIFHLKRFDFDLVDMRRTKINDHFEFPSRIDVSPYNVDHLSNPEAPRHEDIFELVGVLVHQGTSENGHYYSFIRERPSSGSSTTWLEFNDRDVCEFDPSQIAHQAFGGWFDDHQFQRTQKQFSAYMLFYQRKSAIEADHQEYLTSLSSGPAKVAIPPQLDINIATENELYVREYCLQDPNHSKFVRQMLSNLRTVNGGVCSEEHQQERTALAVTLEHVHQVVSRLRDTAYFDEIMMQLKKTTQTCTKCCRDSVVWMSRQDFALVGLMLRCPHLKVRAQTRTFLLDCLKQLRDKDPALYGADVFDTELDTSLASVDSAALGLIASRLKIVAENTSMSTRGWDDFYLALCQLSKMGPHETAVLLREGLLSFCLEIFCMHYSDRYKHMHLAIWRLVEKKKFIYNRMIELIHTFLAQMDFNIQPVADDFERFENFDRTTMKFPLLSQEMELLSLWHEDNKAYAALDRMIESFDSNKSETFFPGEIIKLMLASHRAGIRNGLLTTVSEGIALLAPPHCEPYVRCAKFFCEGASRSDYAKQVILTTVKASEVLREQSGDVFLQFFRDLLTLENGTIFAERGDPDWFYDQAIIYARRWAVPLLMYEDDNVRKNAAALIEYQVTKARPDEVASDMALKWKYESCRLLAGKMIARIKHEHDQGTLRIFMQPMIQTCQAIVQALLALLENEDEAMEHLKSSQDPILIQSWRLDIETHCLRNWLLEEDTLLSGGEAYDDSQYASDSDEAPEIES